MEGVPRNAPQLRRQMSPLRPSSVQCVGLKAPLQSNRMFGNRESCVEIASWRKSSIGISLAVSLTVLICANASFGQSPSTRPTVGLQENVPSRYILQGARVVVAPGRVLESASVIVSDGVIEAVAVEPPSATAVRVIDCTGKTIYAGFIDAYSEISVEADDDGTRHWNRGVHPELRVADVYKPEPATNRAYRKSGFVARLVAPKQGQLKGVSALVSTADGDASKRTLREEVALHATLTVAGRGREGFPGSPMGALTLFRQTFHDVQWYRDVWRMYRTNAGLPRPEINAALRG